MTSIGEFSDVPKYTIKSVSIQTGIRTVTLRAWERRHEILSPFRAENHYRLYSDRDIALLRWIKNRTEEGIAISNIANELHKMIKNSVWPEAIPTLPVIHPGKASHPPLYYSKQLHNALIHHDEGTAGDLFREFLASFELLVICMEILAPVLVQIGEDWFTGKIRISTEHFASTYLRGKLLSLLQAFPSRHRSPFLIVGCAPAEQHEIGSLMLSVLLRSEGYRVEYLGPDLPLQDLVNYAQYQKPGMIILDATMIDTARSLEGMAELLKIVKPLPYFCFGGAAFINKPALKTTVEGYYLGDTLGDALSSIHDLLPKNGHSLHNR